MQKMIYVALVRSKDRYEDVTAFAFTGYPSTEEIVVELRKLELSEGSEFDENYENIDEQYEILIDAVKLVDNA